MKTALTLVIALITMTIQSQEKASLQYLVRQPKVKTTHPPVVILMHGVGSNENDLFSLADQFPDNFLVLSARGPLTLSTGRYAWFHVDFATGKPVINFEEQEKSRQLIAKFISEIKNIYHPDNNNIYLCGFSQGGIMSYGVALTNPGLVKGIAVMSGRLLQEIRPMVQPSEELKKLNVFISHGVEDELLTIDYARDAKQWLENKGISPEYHEYHAAHQLLPQMANDMLKWLGKTVN
ncbi:MAG: esterase [Flavobacterium psychrophilum]|nr:MAG: esterase [Flavobacterium psychrophilum]